jgi:tRNA pseudouridine55 synthase
MARRKKGRDISGWLVIDKPAGVTSTTVVNRVRRAFDAKKAGHAGTLDPDATGILPVAFGEATKTIPYLEPALKAYDFTMRFGAATDSDDASGAVIETRDARPTDDAIRAALPAFTGDIEQVPPRVSAVKLDGARAYDLAREGAAFELKSRPLYVDELTLTDRPDADHARLMFVCGSGGYVRSIARDLGDVLGCLGHVTSLRRSWVGPFDEDHAVTLETVEQATGTDALDALLRPVAMGLFDLPELKTTAEGAARMKNGQAGDVLPGGADYGDLAWASFNGQPVAVGRARGGTLQPERVFNL